MKKTLDSKDRQLVVPEILKLPGVDLCHAVAGDVDLLVRACAESAESMSAVRETIAAIAGITSVTTHVVLEHHR